MKTTKLFLLAIIIGAGFALKAQTTLEDVVYLKNGNIYRGIIIEEVPNTSLKIQTTGGNVFNVSISEVSKLTREPKFVDAAYPGNSYKNNPTTPVARVYTARDSARMQWQYRKRGYFFQSQLVFEGAGAGFRIVNGYRIGRFGYLGIGVGLEGLGAGLPATPFSDVDNQLGGVSLPVYLYYEGDILKKRITPFYSIEAGYAAFLSGERYYDSYSDYYERWVTGGAIAGAGFGVKFHTRRRLHITLSGHLDMKHFNINTANYYYDPNTGYSYNNNYGRAAVLFFPGFRFGLGF